MQILRRVGSHPWVVPIGLLALCVISYGPFIPWLGFFWDDWPKAWFLHQLGPFGFLDVYAHNRPFLSLIYLLTTPFVGQVPWHWQVLGLFSRWIAALAVWWAFRTLWPRHPQYPTVLAALVVVYPSFRSQHVSLIYSHFLLLFAAGVSSLGLMLSGLPAHRRRWLWTVASLACQALNLFSLEYFLGLEALRPILIWRAIGELHTPTRGRIRQTLRVWAPYLAVTLLYLGWRISYMRYSFYQPVLGQAAQADLGGTVAGLLHRIGADVWTGAVVGWLEALTPPSVAELGPRRILIYAAAALLAALLAVGMLWMGRSRAAEADRPEPSRQQNLQMITLGVWGLATAGWPYWVASLSLSLAFPWDRLSLPMMLAACLSLTGVIGLLPRLWPKILVTAVLAGMAAGFQLRIGDAFRRDWLDQRAFFWQLAWRAPGLEPGTVLLTNEIPLLETDNSLTAPLNWMYAPKLEGEDLPYMLYYLTIRLGLGLEGLEAGTPISQPYRMMTFRGSTSQALAVFYQPPACVRVLDVVLDDSFHVLPNLLSRAVPLSRLELIDPYADPPARPPEAQFGAEPEHGWCYYFEKADLARQVGDWELVAALGDAAFALAENPNESSERLPFIEGYAHVGQWGRAEVITQQALDHNQAVLPMLCNTWRRIQDEVVSDPEGEQSIRRVLDQLGCQLE